MQEDFKLPFDYDSPKNIPGCLHLIMHGGEKNEITVRVQFGRMPFFDC